MRRTLIICIYLLSFFYGVGQSFEWVDNIPVIENDQLLTNPWNGGINSVQVNMIDLNLDGTEELILYERTSNKVLVYEYVEEAYQLRPSWSEYIPRIDGWMLARDLNNDGKKDIFTNHPLGIQAYINESTPGNPRWRNYNGGQVILSEGVSGAINIYNTVDEIPAIDDMDGDGKLDIAAFGFTSNSVVFHKNMATSADTLVLEITTNRWGEFEECGCGTFAYEDDCGMSGGRIEHNVSRSILTVDTDGDGDLDLLLSEDECTRVYYLENRGTREHPLFRESEEDFPSGNGPAQIFVYPIASKVDLDQDGKEDLIVTTNTRSNVSYAMNFRWNFQYYRNTGTNESPTFQLLETDYLQNAMIDVGENAWPELHDIDNDGDLDLFIGRFGELSLGSRLSSLFFYENIGNAQEPVFQLVDENFLGFREVRFFNVRFQMEDLDNDQISDIIWSANAGNSAIASIYVLPGGSFWTFSLASVNPINTGIEMGLNDNFLVHDIDEDGNFDVLIAKSDGNIEYHKGSGNWDAFSFELITDEFYGFSADASRGVVSMDIEDFDGDGGKDFIIGYQSGKVAVFYDFTSSLEEPPLPSFLSLSWKDPSEPSASVPFSGISVKAANLFYDDLPALVVGTKQGGILLFRNVNAIQKDPNQTLQVTPTFLGPNNDGVDFRYNRNMIVEVYNSIGQQVTRQFRVNSEDELLLRLNNLNDGMYFARIYTGPEDFEVFKFVVSN